MPTISVAPRTVWSPAVTSENNQQLSSKRALLVHGLGGAGYTWFRVAEGLVSHGYEVMAPDLSGHGLCQMPASSDAFKLTAVVESLRPLLSPLPDVIIGHSMGSVIALLLLSHLLASLPERSGHGSRRVRVVLVDPGFVISPSAMESIKDACLGEMANIPSVDEYLSHPALTGWTRGDAVNKVAAASMCNPEAVKQISKQNMPWDYITLLPADIPTVSVTILSADPTNWGLLTKEDVEKIQGTEKIRSQYPHVRIRAMPGLGHFLHLQDPKAVVEEAIRAWKD